jgi:hypothetical protein
VSPSDKRGDARGFMSGEAVPHRSAARSLRTGAAIGSEGSGVSGSKEKPNADLLISDGCDWSGVIAKLFAKSMLSTRKAG